MGVDSAGVVVFSRYSGSVCMVGTHIIVSGSGMGGGRAGL